MDTMAGVVTTATEVFTGVTSMAVSTMSIITGNNLLLFGFMIGFARPVVSLCKSLMSFGR